MQELIIMMAGMSSKEELVGQVSEYVELFNADQSDDNFGKLAVVCTLILTKMQLDKNGSADPVEGMSKMMDDFQKVKQARDLLNPGNQ